MNRPVLVNNMVVDDGEISESRDGDRMNMRDSLENTRGSVVGPRPSVPTVPSTRMMDQMIFYQDEPNQPPPTDTESNAAGPGTALPNSH